VNSREDADYRLVLARGYLSRAEKDAAAEQWDGCLANAQEAVENAGKSILAHFRPTPRAHDVIGPLEQLLRLASTSEEMRQKITDRLDLFRDMGLEIHIRATYGDEEKRTPPWELIQEPEARAGLEKARGAVALAERIFVEMTKPPDSETSSSESTE
jgi:HEPN domain-containing protein